MNKIVFIFTIVCSFHLYADIAPSIANINTSLFEGQVLPLSKNIQYELQIKNSEELGKQLSSWDGISMESLTDSQVRVTQVARPKYTGSVDKSHLASSFVVDFDEAIFDEVSSLFYSFTEKNKNDLFTLHDIESFVNKYIDSPTYIHGFNIASQIAQNKSGDCTEFAVLSTAIARQLSMPARVIIGVAIVDDGEQVAAYGHAWAEVWTNERWNIIDAALHTQKDYRIYYFPNGALENEDMGYAMGLFKSIRHLPAEIVNIRSVN